MTTVEKRRSSRKSHRKHNDGGYSDTETDREVSSLTDRAFRSLCIGDEAVYNDSDLSASPCAQRDRQLALSHNVQEREDRERQELKRTAHESFSLRVQQYGQDWNYRGTYGAAIHKDQQWGVCGERGTQGRLSATFQQSFVEAAPQECPSRELSLYSNGTAEVSSQPRRSHSRVSSFVQAFNSEGQRDEALYNNETSWDKSALMSIERELSDFSSYPQNMNTGYFPSAGLFSSQNYYSSEVAAISQMSSATSFMRSSHSMSTQANCNSNFFIHSEFSPFKVWRDHNRFPFHRGQVSGFVPCSEFQKWYETPMYKELSLQPQQHPSMFSDQGYHRNTFAPAVPMNPQRSTSASSMMQRASGVEKRCESVGQYRKRAQSTGANRLPPQRPSTASPSGEMSRQVRDTISSVKSLQQKIKMMAEQNLETQSQGGFYNSNYLSPYGPMVPNTVSSNPNTAPYQMQKSPVYALQEPQQFVQPYSVSPLPVEHAPVRAESRGATPDIKMSSYKSRAASLFYNLKDNRKRVKATYSPSKFKGMDTQEKYKQEPKDFVIDVPEYPQNELVNSTEERPNRFEVGQYGYQAHSPRMLQNSQYPQTSYPEFENPTDRNRLNVPQYGYQVHSPGMVQYPQHTQYPPPEFITPTASTIRLNVPQYGYQARSPGNSQHKPVNPVEDRGNRLDAGPYGYQAHSPRALQSAPFPQNSQNIQNSQQLYPGQNPSEYYRAQMQGEAAPHHGFTGYTPEYYANNKLANGQNPYENTSSFTPYKQGVSDTGEGNYVNQLGQSAPAEMHRFGAVGQSRHSVSKDNSKQQFNEAASGEFTGVDRYNQLKENKYDYNNVYSQGMWGQTNSQETQRPGIPLTQNYQNINAYQRTNAQDNVQSYNYEQKLIENYAARPQGAVTSNVSNQRPQYPPPHPANAGNLAYSQHNTQQNPGTYRDIYAPPTSHEYNKENKMKENYAPQDNHKYYDQESKKQSIISTQGGVPIATEELGQRKETAIKENGMKGMQSKETRHFENSQQEEKAEQEQAEEISKRDQGTNGQVSLQQNVHKDELNEIMIVEERPKAKPHQHKEEFEEDLSVKNKSVQDKDLPTAEEQIKRLREEKSTSDPAELQELTDEQGHVVETELQRPDTEQQLRVQHTNAEELKEEAIKCELAASSNEARIEQVKPEPGRKERVITDQANETQVGAEHVERKIGEERHREERSEAKQAVAEQIMENHTNAKLEEKKEAEMIAIKDKTSITEVQNSKQEKHCKVQEVNISNEQPMSEESAKNVNNVQESLPNSEPRHPVKCEPDKVEQAKTELAKTKAELAKIKEKMKGETKVNKDEEHVDEVNDNSLVRPKEPPVTNPDLDLADRGAEDYNRIREKYGYVQPGNTNKTYIKDKDSDKSTLPEPDKNDGKIENKVDPNMDGKKASTNSEVIPDSTESNEKTKNTLYEDLSESQYVYSESSKDFKLSVANNVDNHEDKKGVCENATKQDAPVENVEKLDVSQQRNDTKQVLADEYKLSKSNLPDNAEKGTVVKNNYSQVNNVPVEKVEKLDISQQKDPAKHAVVQRKQKSSDQHTGTSKETLVKGLAHKDKAQTKQEILTSKIKAHAEKEISAIKEGFAIRDGFKNPTKPLAMSQNVSIRQKPPSQELNKRQERALYGDTSKVLSPVPKTATVTGQPVEPPQKQAIHTDTLTEKAATATSMGKTTSIKSTEKSSIQKDQKVKCNSPTDVKMGKTKHRDKSLTDHLDRGDLVDPENTAPSLQLVLGQNESSAQDDSLKIMGIMVTVRERKSSETNIEENKGFQELPSAKCHNTEKRGTDSTGVETSLSRLFEKPIASQIKDEYNKTKDINSEKDSATALESIGENCTSEKMPQESSLPIDRPQRETQLHNHLAEKAVPLTVTVPAKNKVLAATQPVPNKQDIIAEETKDYANRAPNVAPETTGIKGQEEITEIRTRHELEPTIEMNRVISVPTTSKIEKSQEDSLHIDSIAIRVVPGVTEEVKTTGPVSSVSATVKEIKEITDISSNHHQKSSPSNDDVQKVLSSVRKQAQLLKNSNQQTINTTTSKNTENDQSKAVNTTLDETTKPPIEEGYFQVEKRNSEPQNNSISVGQTPKAVSQEGENPQFSSNSDTVSNKPVKEESHTEAHTSSSTTLQDVNTKTSKQIVNPSNDKSNKDDKPGAGHSHHTRRHHMAKERQRGHPNAQDGTESKAEVKPKPKVPIPEISALADYARLKVIVSKDNEDNVQELPPNKKEGFFPLFQTRHGRRPVFTLDSQEDSVTEKPSQNQLDASIKVSKEPKPVVFPITEKQHQRTGMFKLGDKESKDVKENNTAQQKAQENLTEQTPQDKTNNEKKIKHMLEKSRATQAEEEKKATQREEEQRAREREAIAAQIRERRKKQREADRQEEERKNKVEEQQMHPEQKQPQTLELNEPQEKPGIEEKKVLEEEQQKRAPLKEEQIKSIQEEKSRKSAQEEQKKKDISEDQQKKRAQIEEQKKRLLLEEQQRRAALEAQQKKTAQIEEQKRKAVKEEQLNKALLQEHARKVKEEHLRNNEEQCEVILEEKQRKAAEAITEEQKKRAALEEQQRKAVAEEQLKKSALIEEQKRKSAADEQLRKTALSEEQRRQAAQEELLRKKEQQRWVTLEEQQRRADQEEQKKKAALEEQERQAAQKEQQKKLAEEEQLRRAALIEEQKRKSVADEQRKMALKEEQRRATLEQERKKKMAEEEKQRKAAEEQQRKAALIEKQRRQAAQEEQQRKMAEEKEEQRKSAINEEQKKRAALEEQQRKKMMMERQKAAIEEEQRKATEEQQRKAALIEERRQAAHEEHLRQMAEEEQQRKAAIIEEQKKRAALEEQQRKTAQREQQRKMAEEEQRRKAALIEEEQKQKAFLEELKRKMAEEEKRRKAVVIEEQKKRAALEEQQRKMALQEEQRRATLEEQQRKAAIEEQKRVTEEKQKAAIIEEQRRQAAHEEQLRKMAEEEQQRKAAIIEEQKKRVFIEEQQRRLALEEQQRKAAQEKEKEKAALVEQQRAAQKEQQREIAEEEQQKKAAINEEHKRRAALDEQQRKDAVIMEQNRRAALEEEQQRRIEEEEQYRKAALEEQRRKNDLTEKQKHTRQEEDEKRLAFIREERIRRQIEEAREAQVELERQQQDQHKTEQNSSEVRPQQNKQKTLGKEHQMHNERQTQTVKDTRVIREQDTPQKEADIRARQARNQEEDAEAEEQKQLSEKTEAIQYYSLTSAEVENPSLPQKISNTISPETSEDSSRPVAPVSPAPPLPRSSAASPAFGAKLSMFKVKDNTGRGSSLTKSIKPRFHKNFGEEFRVGSPMERVMGRNEEDQVILRYNAGTPVYQEKSPSTPLPEHRPFSRRSLALDEEDCRSVISNMSDVESFATSAADLADIRALYDSDRPESACSFSSDVSRSLGKPPTVPPKSEKALRRAKRLATRRIKKEVNKGVTEDSYEASISEVANDDAVASPHFAPPISIAHAPPAGSSVSSSHSHHHSLQATPHATAPVSLPVAPPHTSAPVPVPSSQHAGSFSTSAAPKSIPQAPSSPTLHHAPKPVTQYQVESGFPQTYTQRRVMQDIGSGQYYVVDVPVEVKTKTFFDPETGKYVQLNVRESNRNAPQRQPLQGYPQPHLKPKVHAKPQPIPSANAHYQGYHSYPKGYQSAATSSAPAYQSRTPETITQDKQPRRSSMTHQYGGPETEHSYSPDKTPYMDTVNNTDKAHNAVYSPHGSQRAQPEGGRLVNSRRGSRDIISMSELEDFMEVSDW